MAIKTTRELIDFIDKTGKDFSIKATDLNNTTQTVISSDDAFRYITRNYSDRRYTLLSGQIAYTPSEMNNEFYNDYIMWLSNRKRNIDRMYQTLYDYDYVPIENYNRTESETEVIEDNFEHGHVISDEGNTTTYYGKTDTLSGTDTTTYGKTDSLTGSDTVTTTETIEEDKTDRHTGTETKVRNGNEITTVEKSGFNAPYAYTPDTKSDLEYDHVTDTTTFNDTHTIDDDIDRNTTETTTHNTVDTLGGNDQITYGKIDTQGGHDEIENVNQSTHSGTDTDNKESERNLHAFGNIGVTTNQKMATEEITLRQIALAEMLIDNFINDYTFYS